MLMTNASGTDRSRGFFESENECPVCEYVVKWAVPDKPAADARRAVRAKFGKTVIDLMATLGCEPHDYAYVLKELMSVNEYSKENVHCLCIKAAAVQYIRGGQFVRRTNLKSAFMKYLAAS